MLSHLTDEDVAVISACLRAAVEGPFFPEGEFISLFPFRRTEMAAIVARFPQHIDTQVRRAIGSAFNNLIRYPHGHRHDEVWNRWIPVSQPVVEELERKWDTLRRVESL